MYQSNRECCAINSLSPTQRKERHGSPDPREERLECLPFKQAFNFPAKYLLSYRDPGEPEMSEVM